ncbi:MAG: alpha-xylosidase [Chloroflexi bacterium]|nr:alpha-xylosidase [Chloroflexota bacterium]
MPDKPPLVPFARFVDQPPELPVRGRDDHDGPEYVVEATVVDSGRDRVNLKGVTQTGEEVSIIIRVVAPGIVRVLLEDDASDPARVRLARELPAPDGSITLRRTNDSVTIKGEHIQVQVTLKPFHIVFFGPDGRRLLDQNYSEKTAPGTLSVLPFGFSRVDGERVAFHETFAAEPDEHFFGFGEKFTEFDKRGQRLEMWNYDPAGVHYEQTYKNVPFFISTRGYGLFVDSVMPVQFDMGLSNHSVSGIIVPDSALDYYVIAGPTLKDIIPQYAGLVGSYPVLPPKWALGLWVSSGFDHDNADKALASARQLQEHDVPCSVFHIDTYWQRHGCWADMQWDRAAFPDPEGLIRELKAMGYRVSLWMNCYMGPESEYYPVAKENGYFLMSPDGEVWSGDLWGNTGYHPPVCIIDFTHPEAVAWWRELVRPLLRMGVDVLKTDFAEAVPLDVVAHNGMSGLQLHNLYTLLYNDIVSDLIAEETGRVGLVWGRSSYAGGQRHGAQWGGDSICTFPAMASTLRGGLSLGMCGHALWSHDIAGFHGEPTRELYIRWAQFGLLSPLARAHGTTTRLPWDYGDEAYRIFQQYASLRYRLLPYIYSHAVVAHETSLPLLRAMVLEFPDDPNTYAMDLQYMFGADLLVAPIYNVEGCRPVYFPAGRWIDYGTHEIITGPQTRWIEAPLDTLPLYVRANALIPTLEAARPIEEAPFTPLIIDAYLLDHGTLRLHDMDGVTSVSAAIQGSTLALEYVGPHKDVRLRLVPLLGQTTIEQVTLNGLVVPEPEHSENGLLEIRLCSP